MNVTVDYRTFSDPDSRVSDEDLDGREPLHERLREVLAVPDAADRHLRRHVIAPELSNSSILPDIRAPFRLRPRQGLHQAASAQCEKRGRMHG